MLERIVLYTVRRYVDGPARSWLYTSIALLGIRALRSKVGRKPLVERHRLKPGDRLVVDQLDISHRKQMKQFAAGRRATGQSRVNTPDP